MKILILEPSLIGHRAFYLSLIFCHFSDHDVTVILPAVSDVLKSHCVRRGVDLSRIKLVELGEGNDEEMVRAAKKLGKEAEFDQIFIPFFDSLIGDVLSDSSEWPCPVGGIWFHPHALDRKYRWIPGFEKRSRLRGGIHRNLAKEALGKVLGPVYLLTRSALEQVQRLNPGIDAKYLDDPWERLPQLSQKIARKQLELPQERTIFLHIGSAERRKGFTETVEAFYRMAQNEGFRAGAFLLRVGKLRKVSRECQDKFDELVRGGLAKIVDEYVSEEDFIEYFSAAPWVLIPYRKFRYSSGILSNAIASKTPVIATRFGHVGEAVERENLGFTFQPFSSRSLAATLKLAMTTDPEQFAISEEAVEARHPDRFMDSSGSN